MNERRRLVGVVTSNKMTKTVVVRIDRKISHPMYKKQYISSKKYHAHDEKGEYQVGDKVIIQATRPMSATKRWKVLRRV